MADGIRKGEPSIKRARIEKNAGVIQNEDGGEEEEEELRFHASRNPLPPRPIRKRFLGDKEAMHFLNSNTVLQQHPFMSEAAFLVSVICDNQADDQPIIFVNDNFEGMTLFRKEEILGRNCRFLQGKCTNQETVRQLRQSIANGEEKEVEILNYRKNGVPFWNKFLLLPIRDAEKTTITHWCAIQQDITILRETGSDPKDWTPHQVGMWLDHVDFGHYSLQAVSNQLTGVQLLTGSITDICTVLKVASEYDQAILKEKIVALRSNPGLSFSSSFSGSSLSLHLLNSLSPPRSEGKRVSFNKATFFHSENREKITIKCLLKDEVQLFSIRHDATLKRVHSKLQTLFPKYRNFVIQGVNKEGTAMPLESDDDLTSFIKAVLGMDIGSQARATIQVLQYEETVQDESTYKSA